MVLCQDQFALGLSQCPSEGNSLSTSIPAITFPPGISNNAVVEKATRQQNKTDFCCFLHLRVTKETKTFDLMSLEYSVMKTAEAGKRRMQMRKQLLRTLIIF